MNVNWRWKLLWRKRTVAAKSKQYILSEAFGKALLAQKIFCESKRYPLIPVIPSPFHIRRYLGCDDHHLYSFSAVLTEYRVWLWCDQFGPHFRCWKERCSSVSKIKKQNINPLELGDSLRSQSNVFFLWAANLLELMLIYRVNLSWMIQSLLYLSALPNRGKTQQNEVLTPRSIFFFPFFLLSSFSL